MGHGTAVPEPTEPLRPAAQRGTIREDARVVDYAIDARLDTETHRIEGLERITWTNRSRVPASELQFHLYMNAFSAEDTAWMREGRGSHRSAMQGEETPWGYVDVQSVTTVADKAVLELVEGDDPTVGRIALPTPVAPGATIELDIAFVTQLPEVFARTGYAGDFVMAGQWFPKVAVLESDGRWSNHVFTFHSEFYADFGNYRVILDVPSDRVVGATGIRVAEEEDGDRIKLTYEAELVHDFAWTASPDFVEYVEVYDGIKIRQLVSPEFWDDAPAHLAAQIEALDSMQARFGPYPWSTITIVHPPGHAPGAAGMEYPTLYTTSPAYRLPGPVRELAFDQRLDGRFTTVHEFGHQYFQGLLASDEFTVPWLDEGMNTFSNTLVLEDAPAGEWTVKIAGHPLDVGDLLRLDMRQIEGRSIVDQPADAFVNLEGLYGRTVYRKTAAVMRSLRNIVGHPRFDAALADYTQRYRFTHPTADDLIEALTIGLQGPQPGAGVRLSGPEVADHEAVQLDVADFLRRGLRTTQRVAYGVRWIGNSKQVADAGWHRDDDGVLRETPEPQSREPEALVVLERTGDFVTPVEVEVQFEDGEVERSWWDGQPTTTTLRWPGRRVERVTIDPDRHLELEAIRYDNHRYARNARQPEGPADDLDVLTQALVLSMLGGVGP